jgi:FkbM family methyltransferase
MLIDFKELSPSFFCPVKGVIHVGAHKAEEHVIYKMNGIEKTIWVEANPMLLNEILSRTILSPGQSVHLAAAHEKEFEIVRLNVANNGESSSILDLDFHKIAHPHIQYVGQVEIPTRRIDSIVLKGGYNPEEFNFMNIDVQGAELLVLKGSTALLENTVDYIYTEINEKSLYKDCALVNDIDEFLLEFKFKREITRMTEYGWGDAFYVKH